MPEQNDLRALLPNFIAIGPQRTATTWLYDSLSSNVSFPAGVKEPQFFDKHYGCGLDWYLSHFRQSRPGQLRGEAGPSYFHSAEARARIKERIPDCLIICTLREPVARLYSLYRLMRSYGVTAMPFEQTIESHPSMLESSRYAYHLEQWLNLFHRERTLVMLYDDVRTKPQEFLDVVCRFLQIPSVVLPPQKFGPPTVEMPARLPSLARVGWAVGNFLRAHRCYGVISVGRHMGLRKLLFGGSKDLPPMSTETAVRLKAHFAPEIEALEELLGRDLSCWK